MVSTIDTNSAAPPAWFTAALATPVTQRTTMVDGAAIAYRTWGDPGGRGIVLVHGGAAHSRWWDHIGPLLADGRLVVAIDLSGHGDSARRESYSLDQWAREVFAVAKDAGIATPPTVIGHSLGGLVTLRAAALFGPGIEEAILARFRPVPDQPVLGYIADHIAATSIREAEGGWTWKWDPAIFGRQVPPTLLTRLDCRVALFRA